MNSRNDSSIEGKIYIFLFLHENEIYMEEELKTMMEYPRVVLLLFLEKREKKEGKG